jgi:hypothetical protein
MVTSAPSLAVACMGQFGAAGASAANKSDGIASQTQKTAIAVKIRRDSKIMERNLELSVRQSCIGITVCPI